MEEPPKEADSSENSDVPQARWTNKEYISKNQLLEQVKDWKLPSDTKYPTPAFESSLEVLVSLWKINSLPYKYLNELQIAKNITLHINCLGNWEETLWN